MSAVICIIAGIFVAILLNYLADVLPVTGKFSRPMCHKCRHSFTAKEYLFSFHCPDCQVKPSKRYWIVQIAGIVGSLLLAIFPMQPLGYWLSLPLVTFLALVTIIDIEHKAVLIETDIVGAVIGIIYGLIIHRPLDMIIGGLAGAAIMSALYFVGVLFNKVLGNIRHQQIDEVALGLGDVFVCAYLGLIMGWPHIAGMVIIAVLLGGVYSMAYILIKLLTKKYSAFSAIPYVPFLIAAAVIMFYLP
jgi:hypothetical protein